MLDFKDWLKGHNKRLEEKQEISNMILEQMKQYFQPERLSEKTSKEEAIV